MRQEASICLDIIRRANTRHVPLFPGFVATLRDVLDITEEERDEIGEILAADLRESIAFSPQYGHINDEIKRIQGK